MSKCFFKCGLPACKIAGCQLHQHEVNRSAIKTEQLRTAVFDRAIDEAIQETIRRIVREEIAKGGK